MRNCLLGTRIIVLCTWRVLPVRRRQVLLLAPTPSHPPLTILHEFYSIRTKYKTVFFNNYIW